MEKTKSFLQTIFDSEFIEKAVNSFIEISGIENFEKSSKYLQISLENESWRHDSLEEFLADYRKNSRNFYISISNTSDSIYLDATTTLVPFACLLKRS